ncbi:MAG: ankyrin repeat domain-containing protein, partial [Bryobacteraceae bacterium]
MSRDLPKQPNLEHLKKQAKELLRNFQQGDSAAVERLRSSVSVAPATQPKLADALHAIAREYGFATWAKLKSRVEALGLSPAEALKAAVCNSDVARVREVLERYPELRARIDDPLPG